jgi:hypothetical protein
MNMAYTLARPSQGKILKETRKTAKEEEEYSSFFTSTDEFQKS